MAAATVATPSPAPSFENASDQACYYIRRFCGFCRGIAAEISPSKVPSAKKFESIMRAVPDSALIGYAFEARRMYGDKLDQEDLATVARMVATHTKSTQVEDIVSDMKAFTDHLAGHPDARRKFFSYWRVVNKILQSSSDGRGSGDDDDSGRNGSDQVHSQCTEGAGGGRSC
jgi:hypothetical protein